MRPSVERSRPYQADRRSYGIAIGQKSPSALNVPVRMPEQRLFILAVEKLNLIFVYLFWNEFSLVRLGRAYLSASTMVRTFSRIIPI